MGNNFDDQSTKRISNVVRAVEATGISNLPPVQKHPAQDRLTWFLLQEDFDENLEALGAPGNWAASADNVGDGTGTPVEGGGFLTADPVARYTVRDTTQHSGASEGSWVCCQWLGAEAGSVWEPVSAPGGGTRFAKLKGDLDAGDEAEADIWNGDPLALSDDDETVYDWFLEAGKKLVSGNKVMLTRISGKWYVTQSDTCPVDQ